METPLLNSKGVYAIGAGDLFGIESESVQILFAPLGGHISLATKEQVASLESNNTEEDARQLAIFQAKGGVVAHYAPTNAEELRQVDLLLNYIP